MVVIMDGKEKAKLYKAAVKNRADILSREGAKPNLAIIHIGDDPASGFYLRNKERDCNNCGISCKVVNLPNDVDEDDVIKEISILNKDKTVHGILLILPLPKHINRLRVMSSIDPEKDVDGFHPYNIGRLSMGNGYLKPCTPMGIMELLDTYNIPLSGKHCVVIGRGDSVGKPLSMMLMKANATVTVCHTKTKDISIHTKMADILISAAGVPNLITGDMVKDGAVVIDAGIALHTDGKMHGDVDFDSVVYKASYITPTPGGVGPMTNAMLMSNVVTSCESHIYDELF